MYIVKRMGPKVDPCGTPLDMECFNFHLLDSVRMIAGDEPLTAGTGQTNTGEPMKKAMVNQVQRLQG